MSKQSSAQGPHPLDSVAEELIHEVRDRSLTRWRGWLRGENEMGADIPSLRQQFDVCAFGEAQTECVWRLLYESSEYMMHMLMDYVDRAVDDRRLEITVNSPLQFSEQDEPLPQRHEHTLGESEMLPGWYEGWSQRYGQVGPDWKVEKLRDERQDASKVVGGRESVFAEESAPPTVECSFCTGEYRLDEVWEGATEKSFICRICAQVATSMLPEAPPEG